jgi:hypothetical protein
MSVSVPPPLPPVLQVADKVVQVVVDKVNEAIDAPMVVPDEGEPMLVLISKDLEEGDVAVFKEFGKVGVWKEQFINIPFSKLEPCDYRIVDIRLKSARLSLGKEDLTKYNVCHYVSWVQKAEEYIAQVPGNVLTSIPRHAVNKADFDTQLLNPKIVSPSLVKSFLRLVAGCLSK